MSPIGKVFVNPLSARMGAVLVCVAASVAGCGAQSDGAADAGSLADAWQSALDGATAADASEGAVDSPATASDAATANEGESAVPDGGSDGGVAGDAGALQLRAGGASSWTSGNPLNPTPAVVAAYGDGVVIASASSDPSVVGLTPFGDSGVVSKAFVGCLAHDGSVVWSVPIGATGLPSGIAVYSAPISSSFSKEL